MRIIFVIAAFLTAIAPVSASELTADEIMAQSFNRDDGSDSRLTIEMVLLDKNNGRSIRQLNAYSKDYGRFFWHIFFV